MEVYTYITDSAMLVNTHLALCGQTRQGVLIDPGRDCGELFAFIHANAIEIRHIVNTHTHPDHCAGNAHVHELFQLPVLLHEKEQKRLQSMMKAGFIPRRDYPCRFVKDGEILAFGQSELKIVETPGHTDGSISLLNRIGLFSGDLLTGSQDAAGQTCLNFENDAARECYRHKLMPMVRSHREMMVYPGHGPAFKHATTCPQDGKP